MNTYPEPILQVRNLSVSFRGERTWFWQKPLVLKAVQDVSFDLYPGQTLGIVGESGCGKSSIARSVMGLLPEATGHVSLGGVDWLALSPRALRPYRGTMQMIFQDPLASLNPRLPIGESIAEPLQAFEPSLTRAQVYERVREAVSLVGLSVHHLHRYPHEFSGGQCQRIGIARAMIVRPKVLVCDEPVSALDVSIQGQIINLLRDLQDRLGIALLFISHNLSLVRYISQHIMVMYLGQIVEKGTREEVFNTPHHPYTQALLASIIKAQVPSGQSVATLKGEIPSLLMPPTGCPFHTRCPIAEPFCRQVAPSPTRLSDTAHVTCHKPAPRPSYVRE